MAHLIVHVAVASAYPVSMVPERDRAFAAQFTGMTLHEAVAVAASCGLEPVMKSVSETMGLHCLVITCDGGRQRVPFFLDVMAAERVVH